MQHARPDGVLDVVIDVRDAIHQADDLPLQAPRHAGPGVVEDAVADAHGEVEPRPVPFDLLHDAEALLVVQERPAVPLAKDLVQRLLARVTEGRVPQIVPHGDGLDEVLVQVERPAHGAGEARDLKGVRQPRAVVVALGRDEDLCLVLQPAERLGVDDAVAVALVRVAEGIGLLGRLPLLGPGTRGERRRRPHQPRPGVGSTTGNTHGPRWPSGPEAPRVPMVTVSAVTSRGMPGVRAITPSRRLPARSTPTDADR